LNPPPPMSAPLRRPRPALLRPPPPGRKPIGFPNWDGEEGVYRNDAGEMHLVDESRICTRQQSPKEIALKTAEFEGLTLVLAPGTQSGYRGVTYSAGRNGKKRSKPWSATLATGMSGRCSLGSFGTAEEAALTYARALGSECPAQAAAERERSKQRLKRNTSTMSAEEVLAEADASGVSLVLAPGTRSGFRGVTYSGTGDRRNPWCAQVSIGQGKRRHVGTYATAEEAALAYARALGSDASAEAAAGRRWQKRRAEMSVEEVLAEASAEGLSLELAPGTKSGYRGVSRSGGGRGKPWCATIWYGNHNHRYNRICLGSFATAEEAALVYAKEQRYASLGGPDAGTRRRKRRQSGGVDQADEDGIDANVSPRIVDAESDHDDDGTEEKWQPDCPAYGAEDVD